MQDAVRSTLHFMPAAIFAALQSASTVQCIPAVLASLLHREHDDVYSKHQAISGALSSMTASRRQRCVALSLLLPYMHGVCKTMQAQLETRTAASPSGRHLTAACTATVTEAACACYLAWLSPWRLFTNSMTSALAIMHAWLIRLGYMQVIMAAMAPIAMLPALRACCTLSLAGDCCLTVAAAQLFALSVLACYACLTTREDAKLSCGNS